MSHAQTGQPETAPSETPQSDSPQPVLIRKLDKIETTAFPSDNSGG